MFCYIKGKSVRNVGKHEFLSQIIDIPTPPKIQHYEVKCINECFVDGRENEPYEK